MGLEPGDNLSLAGVKHICLEGVHTNLFQADRVCLRINGRTLRVGERVLLADLQGTRKTLGPADVIWNDSSVLGQVYLTADR